MMSTDSVIPRMDAFSFGSLNEALDELTILNTNTKSIVPQKAELDVNGLRAGLRAASNLNTLHQWRITSQPSRLDIGVVTKENVDLAGNCCPFDYEQERHSPKLLHARPHRARINPYYHRKPLYSLWGRSSSSSLYSGRDSLSNRLNGCQMTNGDYYLRSLRSVNSLPRLCEAEGKEVTMGTQATSNFEPSSFLFEDDLKRKTEMGYCPYPLPVPVLTRSKSLEDLRESVKPKLKSLSTDMSSSSNGNCSFDASALSPRRAVGGRKCRNGSPTTFPMLYPRRIFENSGSTRITSREVDSMSLLIGKLDVS